jgi:hypothetical protein
MVPMLRIINKPHADREILTALHVAADELEVTLCWYYRGDFHFRLLGGVDGFDHPGKCGVGSACETWIRAAQAR